MKKLALLFSITLVSVIGSFAQRNHFILNGKTNNIPDSTMLYLDESETNQRIDSCLIINNQFVFEGRVDSFKAVFIFTQYDGQFQYAPIYLEPNNMIFDASQSNFLNAKISGSKLQSQANELNVLVMPTMEKAMQANDKVNQIYQHKLDTTGLVQLKKERDRLFQLEESIVLEFIKAHPDYLISVQNLASMKYKYPKSEVKELYLALSKAMKNTNEGKSIKLWLEESIQLKIGDKAPDFQLPNLKNESISLSDFSDKYVLLEFGASGCGPCRMENPNLLKAYKKYKNQGFAIVSVWLDKNPKNWAKTVKKDEMIWTTVCDLKGHEGKVPLIYNINSIPSNFLLDREGVVIAKNLRGDALQEAVSKLFEN